MYNIVLIGCGHMGSVHLDDIYLKDNICLYGVSDINEDRAKYFMKKYGAKSYSINYMDYMKDPNVNIVICATYTNTHLQILKDCIKYKKHLLCEKPITKDLKSAEEFLNLCQTSNIKVQIGYILRFNKSYQKLAELIQNNVIGKPLIMRMCQNHHIMDWQKYGSLMKDASPLVDCGVHYFDVAQWFSEAEITKTTGISSTLDAQTPKNSYNYTLASLELSDGSIAYYEVGWGNTVAAENKKEFIGPKGRLTLTEKSYRHSCQEEGDLIEHFDYPTNTYHTYNINCKRRPTGDQLQHLIDMIEKDVEPIPTYNEIYKSFRSVLKLDEKLRNKTAIN